MITNLTEKIAVCVQELMESRACVYQVDSADELTEVLETISLLCEEHNHDFTFTIEGKKVVFQLHD